MYIKDFIEKDKEALAVPQDFINIYKLSLTDATVLSLILSFYRSKSEKPEKPEDNRCQLSNSNFESLTGLTKKTIIKTLNSLGALNLIEIEYSTGKINKRYLSPSSAILERYTNKRIKTNYYLIPYAFLKKNIPLQYAFIYSTIGYLYYHQDTNGEPAKPIYPSNNYFKKLYGVSPSTVERALKKGKELKLLTFKLTKYSNGTSFTTVRGIVPNFNPYTFENDLRRQKKKKKAFNPEVEYSPKSNPKLSAEEIEAFHKLRPNTPPEIIEQMKKENGIYDLEGEKEL